MKDVFFQLSKANPLFGTAKANTYLFLWTFQYLWVPLNSIADLGIHPANVNITSKHSNLQYVRYDIMLLTCSKNPLCVLPENRNKIEKADPSDLLKNNVLKSLDIEATLKPIRRSEVKIEAKSSCDLPSQPSNWCVLCMRTHLTLIVYESPITNDIEHLLFSCVSLRIFGWMLWRSSFWIGSS